MEQRKSNEFWAWCKRYLSWQTPIIAAALVYVLFVTDNSIINHCRYDNEIEELKAEIKLNRDSMEYYNYMNSRLETDRAAMEQIVREQYHMQRPGEDVYLIK